MPHPVLIVPGINNSGPEHWQSRWQQQHPSYVRAPFADWDTPDRHDWVAALDETVRKLGPDTVIVAHSLGTLAVAHWAAKYAGHKAPVAGALLVAVPDPDGANFPPQARNFKPLPLQVLGFPSVLVASDNDPYSNPVYSAAIAQAWGSRFISIGAHGHINAASGLGDWRQGQGILEDLLQEVAQTA
ncbi:alpha/beta hydrolase [Pseudoduganella ginsengisoli]|uniref:Alpha/beta fold hydrolase n=1 Tax=Pseudoduganella ginsengisoli TaxID=1462440 RepID=A0A6L6Q5K8_9BURK|nr:alpha/beta hydrolase [Pseudoduganella ginsengisoli]MTW04422.1 alpha/beta fold hydrolase [Pseudoduganella ginsengisoli]